MSDRAYTPPPGTGDTADHDRAIRRWIHTVTGTIALITAARPG